MTITRRIITVAALVSGAIATPPDARDEARTLRFDKKRLFVSTYQAASVADIDRDGKLDIVSGPYWFRGPDFEPHAFRANQGATNYLHSNSDLPYDVDRDGWTDIIVGAWGEEGIVWFRNPGAQALAEGTPWQHHQLSPTKGKIERSPPGSRRSRSLFSDRKEADTATRGAM
jgi:hypothetical protein